MPSVDRTAILERLKHSVQLLACPADVQLRMMPDFVCKADELALDFDHWNDVVLSNLSSELRPAQKASLAAISNSVSEMTQAGPTLWTEDSVRQSDQWAEVRVLAAKALESFNWPSEIPPSHADEFVNGH
jgi:hypothetical protein